MHIGEFHVLKVLWDSMDFWVKMGKRQIINHSFNLFPNKDLKVFIALLKKIIYLDLLI